MLASAAVLASLNARYLVFTRRQRLCNRCWRLYRMWSLCKCLPCWCSSAEI